MNWSRCHCGGDDGSVEDTLVILSHFLSDHVGVYLASPMGQIEKSLFASIAGNDTVAGRSAEVLGAAVLRLFFSLGSLLLVLHAVRECLRPRTTLLTIWRGLVATRTSRLSIRRLPVVEVQL